MGSESTRRVRVNGGISQQDQKKTPGISSSKSGIVVSYSGGYGVHMPADRTNSLGLVRSIRGVQCMYASKPVDKCHCDSEDGEYSDYISFVK